MTTWPRVTSAGSDRANATPRSTQVASSASSRTDSLSTRIQPGISRPRITTSRAGVSSTRRSDSEGSTRSMSPPWPLADTARLPFTRNARPPNIRCSRTPSSPATQRTDPRGQLLVVRHPRSMPETGSTVTSPRRASSLQVMTLDERNAHHVRDSHAADVARGSEALPKLRGRSRCRRTTRSQATRSRGRTRAAAAPRLRRKEARSAGSSCGPSRFPRSSSWSRTRSAG